MKKGICGLFLAITLSAQSSRPATSAGVPGEPEPVTACELLQHPEKFDGRVIETRLVAGNSFHVVAMFDPDCNLNNSHRSIQPTFFPPYNVDSKSDKAFRRAIDRHDAVW